MCKEIAETDVKGESLTPPSPGRIGLLVSTKGTAPRGVDEEEPPSTWGRALHRFFVGAAGPPLVVLSISGFVYARLHLSTPVSITEDLSMCAAAILFWWVQEYVFHRVLLHSPHLNWTGKSIHRAHHERHYFHVAIDPPELLLGWLFAAHMILKAVLPWHLCLSGTIGYASAGLVYEFCHYIVHTRVKPPSTSSFFGRFYKQLRSNHIRHHLVDDRYWFAFSVPALDDVFGTNPGLQEVEHARRA